MEGGLLSFLLEQQQQQFRQLLKTAGFKPKCRTGDEQLLRNKKLKQQRNVRPRRQLQRQRSTRAATTVSRAIHCQVKQEDDSNDPDSEEVTTVGLAGDVRQSSDCTRISQQTDLIATPVSLYKNRTGSRIYPTTVSGYMVFAAALRKSVKDEFPDRSFGEITRTIGAKWKSLSKSQQFFYNDRARSITSDEAKKKISLGRSLNTPISLAPYLPYIPLTFDDNNTGNAKTSAIAGNSTQTTQGGSNNMGVCNTSVSTDNSLKGCDSNKEAHDTSLSSIDRMIRVAASSCPGEQIFVTYKPNITGISNEYLQAKTHQTIIPAVDGQFVQPCSRKTYSKTNNVSLRKTDPKTNNVSLQQQTLQPPVPLDIETESADQPDRQTVYRPTYFYYPRFVCQTCGHTSKTSWALGQHELKHTNKKIFSCATCRKTFKSHIYLRRHSIKHSNTFPCTICERNFRCASDLARHNDSHARELKYACKYCNERFTVQWDLYAHESKHREQKELRFLCGVCGKGFWYRSILRRHLLKHENEQSAAQRLLDATVDAFQCVVCDQRFATATGIIKHHDAEHAGMLPEFSCRHCAEMLRSSVDLRRHVKVHEETRKKKEERSSFDCEVCGREFSKRSSLQRHAIVHEGDEEGEEDGEEGRREGEGESKEGEGEEGVEGEEEEEVLCQSKCIASDDYFM